MRLVALVVVEHSVYFHDSIAENVFCDFGDRNCRAEIIVVVNVGVGPGICVYIPDDVFDGKVVRRAVAVLLAGTEDKCECDECECEYLFHNLYS